MLVAACGTPATARPAPTATSPIESQWLRHMDRTAGFSIDYPASWSVYASSDPGVQFLTGPDGTDFVQVRVISQLPVAIAPTDTRAMKRITDALLTNQSITPIRETQVTFGGVTGWEYVYTFSDRSLGGGVHVHVFLFQGARLHTLIFQALPESRLEALAPIFDEMLSRYRALPPPQTSVPAPRSVPVPSQLIPGAP
jgi:hypothetical protein